MVRIDPRYFRPAEVEALLGDPSQAREKLGWTPCTTLEEMVKEMIAHDREEARKEAYLKREGFLWWDQGNSKPLTMQLIKPSDRIFVAGARGMAGSAIVRALKRNGYGDPGKGGMLLTPSRHELNLLDDGAVCQWMKSQKPDVVVLAAATVGGIEANRSRPADFLLQNLRIETQVIEAAWRTGTRRLLFLGSSCIYPKFAEQPIREESLLTGALEPTNAWYAIAKIAGIKLCQALRFSTALMRSA